VRIIRSDPFTFSVSNKLRDIIDIISTLFFLLVYNRSDARDSLLIIKTADLLFSKEGIEFLRHLTLKADSLFDIAFELLTTLL
jgi:hypothetical protein